RVLNQIIEMMFPFPAFGSFNFDARELSIQSIDDTESDGSEDSQPDAAKRKRRSRNATYDESCNRNLVGRDSRFAKERDYRRFNWRVDISGKIQGAFLRRIQNDALSKTMVLCPRRQKTEWPHVAAHTHDVIVNFRRVHGADFTGLDLLFELLNEGRAARAR